MILNIILLILSLAAKCSSMPPTHPGLKKLVQLRHGSSQEVTGKDQAPSVKFKPEHFYTPNPCSGIIDYKLDPLNDEGVQYAPLNLEKHKKSVRLCTQFQTSTTMTFDDYYKEEERSTETAIKSPHLEPKMEPLKGPKVYSQFIPGHDIRTYPYWNNYGMAVSKLEKHNEKPDHIFHQHITNYETESKPKNMKLAIFNVAADVTRDDERFPTTPSTPSPRPTSQSPQWAATRSRLRNVHLNSARDYKSPQISHMATASGLLRMVAHPVGILKPGIQESTKTRLHNTYIGRS